MTASTPGPAQPENALPQGDPNPAGAARALGEKDLESALQLLVERARYITGATGAALALQQDTEMVCVASSGTSAPAIGARLQVASGLTGEAVSRKQLLRCDNAESDARVNLDTCHELGIASIVVLPLVSRAGQVRGLFELFSDHPYAFEERDLSALERMADLTRTALELSEKRSVKIIVPKRPPDQKPPAEQKAVVEQKASAEQPVSPPTIPAKTAPAATPAAEVAVVAKPEPVIAPPPAVEVPAASTEISVPASLSTVATASEAPTTAVPDAMRRVQKCASCGFPISEGRTLCVDCEQKRHLETASSERMPAEFVPTFGSAEPVKESWLASHVNLLAILVLILSIAVAVVVFR
jgi:putative methionine-R-sulfoxide reductase with GAF domain